jgi:hypothetical protein
MAPNSGMSAFAARQGAAAAVANPPDASSKAGDPPGAPAATGGIAAVPEPSTWALLSLGIFGLGAALRRAPRLV